MPLIAALMNWLLRGQRPGMLTLAAAIVALAGVLLVITRGRLPSAGDGSVLADAFVLAGVVCWVAYTMGAATMPRFSSLRYTAISMAFGALTIVAITLAASAAGFARSPPANVIALLAGEIAYLSIVAGVLGVLAWNAGIGVLGPANGVLFINLVPITAFAIGVAQGHRFGPAQIVGALLVIGALVVNNVGARNASARPVASRPKFA
jgi:drug/metabolite transporter (DMT)-like permease